MSRRKRRGRPQRRNTRRSTACTRPAETAFQYARGENRRLQDGAAAFVRDAQPTDLRAILQSDLVGSVHLPDVVGLLRAAVGTGSRPTAAGRWYQARTLEPPLQRAFGWDGVGGIVPVQQHAHQARAPGRVGAAPLYGLLDQGAKPGRVRVGSAGVRSGEGVGAVPAEALHQLPHGAGDEAQAARNQAGALTLFGPLDDELTQRQRSRMWHEQSSLKKVFHRDAHGTCIPCWLPGQSSGQDGAAKLVSGLSGKTRCRD